MKERGKVFKCSLQNKIKQFNIMETISKVKPILLYLLWTALFERAVVAGTLLKDDAMLRRPLDRLIPIPGHPSDCSQ